MSALLASHPYFSEKSALPPDKSCVSRFLDDAEEILKTAEAASGATQNPTNFTILIGREGHIHMLADSDWPLASLEAHHGTQTVYRVSRRNGGVAVEGRSGLRRCHLQAESPQLVARPLLAGPTSCLARSHELRKLP